MESPVYLEERKAYIDAILGNQVQARPAVGARGMKAPVTFLLFL